MGGAAGHMNHPFDLGWVNTGTDLLDFFEKAATFVEKKGAGAVKIDGVNVSFKVVGDDDNKQFAVDRGSLKNIDIQGITMDRVDDRFPEGHGMRPAIRTLLTILNNSIGDIAYELKDLGMWDDPSLFLNTEYVAGTTNVTQYDENFLAIHGLNQFYQRTAKSGASKGNVRPGAERPVDSKAPSTEVGYNPNTMQKLIEKLNPVANEYGFQVYGSVPTERSPESDIDYSSVLSEPFTVRVSDDRDITKSLGEWLSEASNPRYRAVQLKSGKKTHALHKELYKTILDGNIPIVDFIEDSDAEAAIYGAVIMHATRLLGNIVLQGLTSPMGNVMDHEGVVLRDDKLFGPNPVKVTGEFILGGMGSGFQKDTSLNEEDAEEEYVDIELEDEIEDEDDDPVGPGHTVALVPGAFKPPHNGHLAMVEEYSREADEVIVLISSPLNKVRSLPNGTEITAEVSKAAWEILTSHLGNVDIRISDKASPVTATYDFIGKNGPLPEGTEVILGASLKESDFLRFREAEKYVKDGVLLRDVESSAVAPAKHSDEYMGLLNVSSLKDNMPSISDTGKNEGEFHASDMRYLLGEAENNEDAVELLEDFVGSENIFDVLSLFGIGFNMNEISGVTSPGIDGAPYAKGGPWRRSFEKFNDEEEKHSKLNRNENMDISIVDDVMRLIMEKGILQ